MVLREMLLVTGLALVIGWGIARSVAPVLASGLIGVNGLDAMAVTVTVLLLAGTAAIATWVPARRAARVDPVAALRDE